MHVNDAKQFLEISLAGFIARNFSNQEAEDPSLFEPHLARYVEFVEDACPYWVKEKSLFLLSLQEQFERERTGSMVTVEKAIDAIIEKASIRIADLAKKYGTKDVTGRMTVFLDVPTLPRKKRP